MSRPIGMPKTGGRQKGTPNKKTLLLAEAFESLNLNVPARLVEFLESGMLTDKDKAEILLSLLPYLYPKRQPEQNDAKSTKVFNLAYSRCTNSSQPDQEQSNLTK